MRIPDEVRRRWRVYIQFDRSRLQIDFLVVRVANLINLERVVTAAIRLYGKLPTRSRERLVVLLRVLSVALRAVVDREWRCTVQNQGSGNADVSRAVPPRRGKLRNGKISANRVDPPARLEGRL